MKPQTLVAKRTHGRTDGGSEDTLSNAMHCIGQTINA